MATSNEQTESDMVHITDYCPSHPGVVDDLTTTGVAFLEQGGKHEIMQDEMRCVYCGIRLAPYNCHGCGRFLTVGEIHKYETRCEDCA